MVPKYAKSCEGLTTILLDDLWIISTDLQFTPANSFIARSTFYGPTSRDHLEVCPIRLVTSHDCHMIQVIHLLVDIVHLIGPVEVVIIISVFLIHL